MRLRFSDAPEGESVRRIARPLLAVPGTVWRVEIRGIWAPDEQRGLAACEITDDATRELVLWECRPKVSTLGEFADELDRHIETAMGMLGELDEPFY